MLTLATIAGLFVAAWPPAVPETLRECLIASGFEIAASVAGGPDLDRRLTSSECAASGDQFVAAFYFADEITGQRLGPFHLATYDKRQGRWTYRPDIDAELEKNGFERGGSALEITIADAFILIETHSTPSANYQLVVDRRLTPLASFCGFHSEVAGRLVFYKGCMVHVAATHQQRLLVFDLRDRQQREIFLADVRLRFALPSSVM